MESSTGAGGFLFSSPDGLQLVRGVLSKHFRYSPHDYQLEGVCKLLDGIDLVAVLPTGAGKSGYFSMYMLMLQELSREPTLQHRRGSIPSDPCMLLIYPTNGLEEEQAASFIALGIKALVINSESTSIARRAGRDLWVEARTGVAMLLMSPEQLASPGFESLLQNRAFNSRICALGIDEIHLLYSWGLLFRKSFRQLGHSRARLPGRTRLLGTTATLLAGHPQDTIFTFLGLHYGQFHLIRRSNIRGNVRTIFRTLTHGIGGWAFPDLKWILEGKRKTVIHCRTIVLGFRVAIYLLRLLPSTNIHTRRIRLYNALNWPDYNVETRRLMREDPDMQIIIATSTFMVGIDLPNIEDIVILGALQTSDEHVQWEGRAGRDPSVVMDARCITYVTSKSLDVARKLCAGEEPRSVKRAQGGTKGAAAVTMELSMAHLLCADCATQEQDRLYNNPSSDPHCSCTGCAPLFLSRESTVCRCSGPRCSPEPVPPPRMTMKAKKTNPIPARKRLSKAMRAEGTKQLIAFRATLHLSLRTSASRFLPPDAFLPDPMIKALLDRFPLIKSVDMLREDIKSLCVLSAHVEKLWETFEEMGRVFDKMHEEKAAEKRARDKKKREGQKQKREEAGKVADLSDAQVTVVDGAPPRDPIVRSKASQRKTDRSDGGVVIWEGTMGAVSSSFQIKIDSVSGLVADAAATSSFEHAWNLNDTVLVESTTTNTNLPPRTRKRASTETPIDSRPKTRARVAADKENENP